MENATEKQKKSLRQIRIAIWVMFAICAALAAYIYIQGLPPPAGTYDALAKCISHTSTTFYGAFWCPHCKDQKTKFGTGAQYLPYVECSLPNGSGQTPTCTNQGIIQYPTWVFPDGSRLVGTQTPETLAKKTGCTVI